MTNWYKTAKSKKNYMDIMQESEHYHITCTGCGNVYQCRCPSKSDCKSQRVIAEVDSCPDCEDIKEASADSSGGTSSQQIYTKNDVIQSRQDIAPSLLRLRRNKWKHKRKRIANSFNLSKFSGFRDDVKRSGSVKVPLPESSEYIGVHVYTQEASNLYGAGTQWCTTGKKGESELKAFPNIVYFIHKTKRMEDDPSAYKLALDIDSRNNAFYTYDAQNRPYPRDKMLQQLGLTSFAPISQFLHDFWQEQIENGYFEDFDEENDEENEIEEELA